MNMVSFFSKCDWNRIANYVANDSLLFSSDDLESSDELQKFYFKIDDSIVLYQTDNRTRLPKS